MTNHNPPKTASESYEIKQVIVVRKDIQMNMGKVAAQSAHAAMAFLTSRLRKPTRKGFKHELDLTPEEQQWLNDGFAKVVVRVDTEEEFDALYASAKKEFRNVHLIVDSGHTQFHGVPTKTCFAIGPHRADQISKITGHLKLL